MLMNTFEKEIRTLAWSLFQINLIMQSVVQNITQESYLLHLKNDVMEISVEMELEDHKRLHFLRLTSSCSRIPISAIGGVKGKWQGT